MSEQQQSKQAQEGLSAEQVVDYLRSHTDFFLHNADLLAELQLPHPETGAAVSLIERQVQVLRERHESLQRRLNNLSQTARDNEKLLERIERLILGLIDATELEQVIARLRDALREDFHADRVEVELFASGEQHVAAELEKVVAMGRPICGPLTTAQRQRLFGQAGEEVASGAIIPLCMPGQAGCAGVLGIGSIDPKRFHPEMGTNFLSHLGAVLAQLVKRANV